MGDPDVCMEGPDFYNRLGGIVSEGEHLKVGNFAAGKILLPKLKVLANARE